MTRQEPAPTGRGRPARADARRNREKLLGAARAAFAAAGDTVSLEGIAREAGVGIGTLYRHFPTREALVDAVYAAELDDIVAGASALLDRYPPEVALRAWMDRYAAFVAMKRGMLDTLRAGWSSGRIATSATRERVTAAIEAILTAGVRAGSLRADVAATDLVAMIGGACLAAAGDVPASTGRLLDLVLDAVCPADRRPARSGDPPAAGSPERAGRDEGRQVGPDAR